MSKSFLCFACFEIAQEYMSYNVFSSIWMELHSKKQSCNVFGSSDLFLLINLPLPQRPILVHITEKITYTAGN